MRKILIVSIVLVILLSGCFENFTIEEKVFDDGEIEAFKIKYLSDGLTISGLLAKPKTIEGKAPLIIFNHGGIGGIRIAHTEWIKRLAKEGYVVLASTYRGEEDFTGKSEGEIEVAYGEVDDVLNLMEFGKRLEFVDSSKIGMIGFSHGGGITVLAIERTDEITTAVEFYGLTNVENHYNRYVNQEISGDEEDLRLEIFEQFRALPEQQLQEELKKRNAIDFVERINTPLLIIHGLEDKNIPVEEGFELANALEENGKTYEMQTYPGVGHGFNFKPGPTTELSWLRTKEWFGGWLK